MRELWSGGHGVAVIFNRKLNSCLVEVSIL